MLKPRSLRRAPSRRNALSFDGLVGLRTQPRLFPIQIAVLAARHNPETPSLRRGGAVVRVESVRSPSDMRTCCRCSHCVSSLADSVQNTVSCGYRKTTTQIEDEGKIEGTATLRQV